MSRKNKADWLVLVTTKLLVSGGISASHCQPASDTPRCVAKAKSYVTPAGRKEKLSVSAPLARVGITSGPLVQELSAQEGSVLTKLFEPPPPPPPPGGRMDSSARVWDE